VGSKLMMLAQMFICFDLITLLLGTCPKEISQRQKECYVCEQDQNSLA
jgi:hypothetical protein